MTDIELQLLAIKYAESYLPEPDSASDMARYCRMKDSSMHFLRWLTKTHCIVSREKVQNAYRENCINEKDTERRGYDDYVYYFRNQQLRDIFGKSKFENNKTTDNEDNKDI